MRRGGHRSTNVPLFEEANMAKRAPRRRGRCSRLFCCCCCCCTSSAIDDVADPAEDAPQQPFADMAPPPPQPRVEPQAAVQGHGYGAVLPGQIVNYQGSYWVAVIGVTTAPNGPPPPPANTKLVWMPSATVAPLKPISRRK